MKIRPHPCLSLLCRVASWIASACCAGASPAPIGVPRSDTAYGVKLTRHVPAKAHRASPSPIRATIIGRGATTTGVQARASSVAPHTLGVSRSLIQSVKNGFFVLDLFHPEFILADRQPMTLSFARCLSTSSQNRFTVAITCPSL